MNKYYYWVRIDKITRTLLISEENPMEFENKEQAIEFYRRIYSAIFNDPDHTTFRPLAIEIDEHIEKETCIDTILISPVAQLIRDGNQHKMF